MGRITWSLPHYCKWSATRGRCRLGQPPVASLCPALYCTWKFLVLLAVWATNRFSACFVFFFNKQPGCQQETTGTPKPEDCFVRCRETAREQWGAPGCQHQESLPL